MGARADQIVLRIASEQSVMYRGLRGGRSAAYFTFSVADLAELWPTSRPTVCR